MSENIRMWTDHTGGYEFVADGSNPLVAHHRLLAYAWGVIDSLYAPVEIDHKRAVGWLNIEDNLQAVEPSEHSRITRYREYQRKNGKRENWNTAAEKYAADGGQR